jgi:hypothetical protein
VAEEGSGELVVEFETCKGTSFTLTDTATLLDGHAYIILLKVRDGGGWM